ncbi:MAG: threonylcarbamoyl-AMP synthase [Aquificota bacterium]|nr:MAG: threonylcarbamoyl-AMP synthase [Aquificota bacterium]
MKVVKLSKKAILDAADVIQEGGIVCFPTDTIYGLLADATNKDAVERLYEIRRPSGRPFLLLIPEDPSILWSPQALDLRVGNVCDLLLFEFNATFVFYKRKPIPQYLLKGRKSFAVRLPAPQTHVMGLLNLVGVPLTAPSANPEGEKPATTIKEAVEYFGNKVDLYVDGGTLKGKPSTIVRCLYPKGLRLIREGNIPFKKILERYKELIASYYGIGDAP